MPPLVPWVRHVRQGTAGHPSLMRPTSPGHPIGGHTGTRVGDPQLGTDHPWYSGELDCSTFERLFATQAEAYKRVTGRPCTTDEDKALAAWLWRNTHYWHGGEGATGRRWVPPRRRT